jgi:hypothetical protein
MRKRCAPPAYRAHSLPRIERCAVNSFAKYEKEHQVY